MNLNSFRISLALALCASPLLAATTQTETKAPTNAAYTNDSDKSGWQRDNTQQRIEYAPQYYADQRQFARNLGMPSTTWSETWKYNKQTLYFPPDPLPLGYPVAPTALLAQVRNPRSTVVTLIAPYVCEFFYPALSTRTHDENIPAKVTQQLGQYREQKASLVSELRHALESLRDASPEVRKAELARLAGRMDPEIARNETLGEEIRNALVKGGFFDSSINLKSERSWRLGDDTRYESYQDEFIVMRAATFLQAGMDTNIRMLLREISTDIKRRGSNPGVTLKLSTEAPLFSFSPFTARFRLPKELPSSVDDKLDAYRELKQEIKDDLRETIYDGDRASLNSTRMKALAAFAERRQSDLQRLENLAEEIRTELWGLPLPDEPEPLKIGGAVAPDLNRYLAEKADFQRTISSKANELRAQLPGYRIELDQTDVTLRFVIESKRGASKMMEDRRRSLLEELRPFNREISKRFEALSKLRETLRLAIEKNSQDKVTADKRSLDRLIESFSASFQVQENWARYAEYKTAVLMPGLSPSQRRLLYQSAMETLLLDLAR